MAENGKFSTSFGTDNKYSLILEWRRNGVDVASNVSNVTFDVYLQSSGSSYTIVSSATKYGNLTLAGVSYNFTFSASLSGNQKKLIYSKTINITHFADGTRLNYEISCSAGMQITFGSGFVNNVVTSGKFSLESVPRASDFTLSTSSATLGSTAVTIKVTPTSSSLTHKVYFNFGSTTATLTLSSNTVTYTPPLSWASLIPNATSGSGSVVVQTYSGSTLVGSKTKSITLSVPSSVIPSFTSITSAVVNTGVDSSFGYIKGKSKAKLTINGATGSYGSTIKSYKITSSIGTWSSSSVTTGELNTVGNITFTATVTDSRGRTSASKSVTINVQNYTKPKITALSIYRCDADGKENPEGKYACVSYKASITPLGNKNAKKYSLICSGTLKEISSTSYELSGSLIYGGSYEIERTYTFEFMVEDSFDLVTRSVILPKAFATMDFKAGGTGVAIGTLATSDNLFEVALPSRFSKEIQIDKGSYVHNAMDGKGLEGYLKICTIDIIQSYCDAPIELTIIQRAKSNIGKIFIKFYSVQDINVVDVEHFYTTGSISAYIVKNNISFDLYVGKIGPYDEVCVTDIQISKYNIDRGFIITWTDFMVATLPSGYRTATNATLYYDTSWDCLMITKSLVPTSANGFTLGAAERRWSTVYAVNALNTSDISYKENIKYIPKYEKNKVSIMEKKEEDITLEDLHNFYKNNYQLASFNYIGQNQTEYGFITRDFYEDKVGESLIIKDESGDMFSVSSYISSIAGALQYEINIRDEQISNQQNEINELKEMVENMAEIIKQLQDIGNNK